MIKLTTTHEPIEQITVKISANVLSEMTGYWAHWRNLDASSTPQHMVWSVLLSEAVKKGIVGKPITKDYSIEAPGRWLFRHPETGVMLLLRSDAYLKDSYWGSALYLSTDDNIIATHVIKEFATWLQSKMGKLDLVGHNDVLTEIWQRDLGS